MLIKSPFFTYLLTPWCRILLKKLTGLQLVKKFPAFHRTRRFITVLTSVYHPSILGQPKPVHIPTSTSWRSILILSTHLYLSLPSGLFLSSFPTKTLYTPLLAHTCHMPSQSYSYRFSLFTTWRISIKSSIRPMECPWPKKCLANLDFH